MKYLTLTACLAVSALALSACETTTAETYKSGASYAADRTAGEAGMMKKSYSKSKSKTESVFSKKMSK